MANDLNRLAVSKQELREFNLPELPRLPPEISTGSLTSRAAAIEAYNTEMTLWRNQVQELFQQWLLAVKQAPP